MAIQTEGHIGVIIVGVCNMRYCMLSYNSVHWRQTCNNRPLGYRMLPYAVIKRITPRGWISDSIFSQIRGAHTTWMVAVGSTRREIWLDASSPGSIVDTHYTIMGCILPLARKFVWVWVSVSECLWVSVTVSVCGTMSHVLLAILLAY